LREKPWLVPFPALSVADTVNENAPATVGVPDKTPAGESVSPGGSAPAAVNVYPVPVPPLTTRVVEYVDCAVASGRPAAVVNVTGGGGGTMLSEYRAVAVPDDVESWTVTETVKAPAAVGVPEITPVCELMLNPAGSPVALQVNGGVPLSANTVAL